METTLVCQFGLHNPLVTFCPAPAGLTQGLGTKSMGKYS
jgi:hypothetical protein